jgi:radical SAM superfamily enzyme YgiQ (UPF0313 family)
METLILINPWIYDFAAYDLWAKPLGLLKLAAFLRDSGFRIHLIDCLDVHHPGMCKSPSSAQPVRREYGTGKFFRERVPKPEPLKCVSRSYSRYGMSTQLFAEELRLVEKPAAILVTSLMTYWYPGVVEAIRLAREIHPGTPVILGGIYARLCREHASRVSGADEVVNARDGQSLSGILDRMRRLGVEAEPSRRGPHPYPSFDLLHGIDYVCLQTSSGCPFRCHYCASSFLNPRFSTKDPERVLEEILFWHRVFGVKDFAFYDDALLMHFDSHLGVVLDRVVRTRVPIRFHTPNALHVREITAPVAELLLASGFKTIRLGLETSDMNLHQNLDGKVAPGEFEQAVAHLTTAGFAKEELGVYILAGLPGQSVDSVRKSAYYVHSVGATPYLAEYSPIPHSLLWEKARSCSEYDLSSEPLFHNSTLLSCWRESERRAFADLRQEVIRIRHGHG